MAIFRKIHVTFWSDSFSSELNNDRKLFYLYLLTNEKTKQCGIYEISKRQISFDLRCSIDTVSMHLKYFIKAGKIQYSDSTSELAIKNWDKFNKSTSPKVVKCLQSEFENVKNKSLIEYLYSTDAVSQEEEEETKEKAKAKEDEELKSLSLENDFNKFWDLYDHKKDSAKSKAKFLTLSQKDIDTILKVVSSYVHSTPEKQYRKHPLTWLNGKCWNDVEINEYAPTKERPFGKTNQIQMK
jgi:hypothetical protein